MSVELTPTSRWFAASAGVACVGVGAVLTLRPFTSLGVLVVLVAASMLATGIAEFAEARGSRDRLSTLAAVGWVAAGVAVLAWPGATITVITVVAGVAMIAGGLLRLWAAMRGVRADRVTAVLSGAASVVFGVLALSWPDVTVLVVAVVFGARTVLAGLTLLSAAGRGRVRTTPREPRRGGPARAGRALRATAGLAIALVLLAVSVAVHRGSPVVDAFYNAPKQVPDQPGQLLHSEAFHTGVPSTANAWRILYTTTRDNGVPALASGIVLVGKSAPAGPRPVIAWAHGTTGYGRPCAPSLQQDPFGAGAMPALGKVIEEGWALVATDYIGLGTSGPHTYMIGQGEGRAVLDAVRAARQLHEVSLSDKTVVWGHSQGGGSALWTGRLAPTYAADVPLAGVVAMAPAADLLSFTDTLEHMIGGSVFESFVISAYSAIYPDVRFDAYVRPGARTIVKRAAQRCLSEPGTLVSIATSLALDKSIFSTSPHSGALGKRLEQNTPTGPISAPLLIAQGSTDQIVVADRQRAYAQRLCASGQHLDYRVYPGLDHIGLVADASPLIGDLIDWTRARFEGNGPVRDTCPTI